VAAAATMVDGVTTCTAPPSYVYVTGPSLVILSIAWNMGLPYCGLAVTATENRETAKINATVVAMNVERKRNIMV